MSNLIISNCASNASVEASGIFQGSTIDLTNDAYKDLKSLYVYASSDQTATVYMQDSDDGLDFSNIAELLLDGILSKSLNFRSNKRYYRTTVTNLSLSSMVLNLQTSFKTDELASLNLLDINGSPYNSGNPLPVSLATGSSLDVNVTNATLDVNVTNTTVDVNVTNTTVDVNVTNTAVDVNVTNATHDVNVVNTPAVTISGTPAVTISGTHTVSLSDSSVLLNDAVGTNILSTNNSINCYPKFDYENELLNGNITHYTDITKFAYSDNIPPGIDTDIISPSFSGTYTYWTGPTALPYLVSTVASDDSSKSVDVYGIDDSGFTLNSTHTLNGMSNVVIPSSYSRINKIVMSSSSSSTNAGMVGLYTSTGDLILSIPAGFGTSPNSNVSYTNTSALYPIYKSITLSASNPCLFLVRVRDGSSVWKTIAGHIVTQTGKIDLNLKLSTDSDFIVSARSLSYPSSVACSINYLEYNPSAF